MRSILLFILCLFFATVQMNAQWVVQTSGATGNLQSVSAVDNNVCWISGATGQVLRTTNGGTTWANVGGGPVIGTANDVTFVYGFDANNALCTTSSTSATYVFKTTNGGTTWTQVFTQSGGFIDAFDFSSPTNGFMMGDPVGARWSMWKTTDGGATWDSTGLRLAQVGTEAGWNNSLFTSGSNIWFGTNNTKIYYSSDNGATWAAQATTGQANSYCIYFSGSTGFTGGASTVAKTTNGGTAWSLATLPGSGSSFGCTASAGTWYVTRTGTVYASADGTTWTSASTSTTTLYAIGKARNGTAVWACGASGRIVRSPVPALAVTAPANGLTWSVHTSQNITWTSSGITNVAIKYSTDAGTTWMPIVASVPASTGTYNWVIPNTPSAQCKVRVSDAAADTVFALSGGLFTISTSIAIPMSMAEGWNMVSVGVLAPDMTATTLFSGANSSVYGYNNGYVVTPTLANGFGYWVRYPATATFNISGSEVPGSTINVAAGWNMIGPYMYNIPVEEVITVPTGIINSSFFGFNNGYVLATTLEKGKGYWVRVSQAGTMSMPIPVAKGNDNFVQAVDKNWGRIIVTDAAGKSTVLYAANSMAAASSAFDLPPVPPPGVFDVRFASQRNAERIGTAPQTILISNAQYPVAIRAEGTELRLRDMASGGKLVNTILHNGEQCAINNTGVTSVEINALVNPVTYELLQNYPNPFNPSTMISFTIPEKAHVSLSVYNQLGQLVTTLFEGEKETGFHSVEWNAENMPSGAYFVTLKTEKFSSVKKLMLMK